MKEQAVLDILKAVESGGLTAEEALTKLKLAPIDDMGFAKVDLHRELRQGIAEVIYGQGKTPEQIAAITGSLIRGGEDVVLITRMAPEAADQSPLWKVSSTTARTFCMNTEGMALMTASKMMPTMAMGSITG